MTGTRTSERMPSKFRSTGFARSCAMRTSRSGRSADSDIFWSPHKNRQQPPKMPFDRFLRARNSLRARLLWWIVPPAIAVGAIGVFVFYTLAARVATDAYDVELFDMAKSLAEQIKTGPAGEPVLALPIE